MKRLLRSLIAVAIVGLVGIVVLFAHSQGWVTFPGLEGLEPPTHIQGGPQPASPGGYNLSGSTLTITDGKQNVLVSNVALDPTPIQQGPDGKVWPTPYPGFYLQPGQTVVPGQGQPGTVTIVGHSGVKGDNEPFTSLMALEGSFGGATALLRTPYGNYDLVAAGMVRVNKLELGSVPKLLDPIPGRVEIAACEVGSDGTTMTGNTLVFLFKDRVPGQSPTG